MPVVFPPGQAASPLGALGDNNELFASAARPLASRFLKEAGALAVDQCLDDREYRSLHRGGQQYLFDGILGF